MDPPTLLNKGSFNLAEIWPSFQLNGCGGLDESNVNGGGDGGGLELRISQFGESLCRLANDVAGTNADDYIGAARKRADAGSGDGNGTNENNESKRIKTSGSKESKVDARKPVEPTKQDYILVRARRGQATDSHSLAERARREKISERMKILQDLVPGCNKVIGKALVLDEIINYVQSLQRQVEFLSMKLESLNSNSSLDVQEFPNRQVSLTQLGQQTIDSATMAFSSQPSREYARGLSPEWLHMQVGGGFERT